jgi:predicted ribosomally synthesized peptide with SipW-like signal peptide
MPNDDSAALNISRRKTLAALGTIGVASAGAGLGTSAYFSDQETFENNSLTAGTLDLVVDWEEHYSDWSDDESDGVEGDILMLSPETTADYTPFPPGTDANAVDDSDANDDPLIWVPNADVETFMDNTSIEAFPDEDDDGVQDEFPEGADPCEFLADVGNDDGGLDPFAGARTQNDDTVVDDEPAPLINLDDVKPGDFGEITLSAHLCGNPGYLWLNGGLVSASLPNPRRTIPRRTAMRIRPIPRTSNSSTPSRRRSGTTTTVTISSPVARARNSTWCSRSTLRDRSTRGRWRYLKTPRWRSRISSRPAISSASRRSRATPGTWTSTAPTAAVRPATVR